MCFNGEWLNFKEWVKSESTGQLMLQVSCHGVVTAACGQRNEVVAGLDRWRRDWFDTGIGIRVGDNDHDGGVIAGIGNGLVIEGSQQVASVHMVALADLAGEILAFEVDGINAKVDEHLSTVISLNAISVVSRIGDGYRAGDW